MTRSIFDPTGPQTERGGSMFTPPAADNRSHMPPSVIDGKVEVDSTDVVEFDASGDEVNGVNLDTRNLDPNDPDAPLMVQEGEVLNPGQAAPDAAAAPEATGDADPSQRVE